MVWHIPICRCQTLSKSYCGPRWQADTWYRHTISFRLHYSAAPKTGCQTQQGLRFSPVPSPGVSVFSSQLRGPHM